MTDEDVNKLRTIIKEEVDTVFKPVNKKLDILWDQTVRLTESMDEVKITVNKIESRVDQMGRKLDRVIDTHIDYGNRIEDIEQIPVIAHELKLKRHE